MSLLVTDHPCHHGTQLHFDNPNPADPEIIWHYAHRRHTAERLPLLVLGTDQDRDSSAIKPVIFKTCETVATFRYLFV